ncbi:MAG: dephospho-CoA kinase [Actinobacteria bacterium BACL2 MAG-121001-bin67]|uniref:Dephospho-CoA kinase n=3 Tax=ac1 cluster TaxID=1655545 RepID=A0A0R2P3A8_9ACTN|nr:MAG: dephospho-CoA kinase [Actinobacteria bacterium BACL2 MAG-121001-bin67]KRO44917.1 MAG: dephospho-CoA kinase [Actinobacteria bacterium BACL2 MAG-120813-bin23]MDP4864114.1 dephospho-CoA kinase [Candidatus Nanopelagicaceae bacterium]MDP5045950.1 dephospho-CoA kinase [Candidatus Nanopelagicaceae bacterium]
MLRVALTGGIGSGKSLVGEILEELGALVIDSDQLAREVIERGSPGYEEVITAFGDSILSEGQIDRAKLAAVIFKEKDLRKKLESIIHPLVREAAEKLARNLPSGAILVNQIPLLVESDGAKRFDYVITVSADEEIRRERLRLRGLKDYEITERMAAQVADLVREKIANYILRNDGSIDELTRAVEELMANELLPRAQRQGM